MQATLESMRAMFPSLGFESPADGVLELVIANEGRQNAATEDMHRELADVWRAIDAAPAVRAVLVGVLALATGAAVAQTGLIAFVGLASPHLVRSIVKTTHGRLVVLAAFMGGLLLMAADVLARWVIAPQELPVGVLTAVLGGSYLLWLMHRRGAPGGFK